MIHIILTLFISLISLTTPSLGHNLGGLYNGNPNYNRPLPALPNNVSDLHLSHDDNDFNNITHEDKNKSVFEQTPENKEDVVENQNNNLKDTKDVMDDFEKTVDEHVDFDKKLPSSYHRKINSFLKKYLLKKIKEKIAKRNSNLKPDNSTVNKTNLELQGSDFNIGESIKTEPKETDFGVDDSVIVNNNNNDNVKYHNSNDEFDNANKNTQFDDEDDHDYATIPSTSKHPTTNVNDENIYDDVDFDLPDLETSSNYPYSSYDGSQYSSTSSNPSEMSISLKDYLRSKKRGIGRTYQRHVGDKITNIKDRASNAVGSVKNAVGDRLFKTKYAIGNAAYNAKVSVVNAGRKAKKVVTYPVRKVARLATAPSRKVKKLYRSFRTYPKENVELKRYDEVTRL